MYSEIHTSNVRAPADRMAIKLGTNFPLLFPFSLFLSFPSSIRRVLKFYLHFKLTKIGRFQLKKILGIPHSQAPCVPFLSFT